jgi:hypothetical protein
MMERRIMLPCQVRPVWSVLLPVVITQGEDAV